MPVSSSFLVLTWGLLLSSGAGVPAPDASVVPLEGVRRIELGADSVPALPEVRIAPGLSTTVFFDSRIEPEYVELEGRERFVRMGISEDHLALVPSRTFRHGERLRLDVRFGDGAAPARASFMLVVDADRVERQVEVYRQPRTAESYRQEMEELNAKLWRLRQEVERLRVLREPRGVEALVASLVESRDVEFQDAPYQRVSSPFRLTLVYMRVVRLGTAWAGLSVGLTVNERGKDWTAVGASLRDAQGRTVRVLPPWQSEPLRFGQPGVVVIPLEATTAPPLGRVTLELRDEGGGRTVTIEGIDMP